MVANLPARCWQKCILTLLAVLVSTAGLAWSAEASDANYRPGTLLEKLLAGPLAEIDEIVFAERVSGRDHWYVTFGYYSCQEGPGANLAFGQYPDGKVRRGYGEGGRLCRLNLRTGKQIVILDEPLGGVRDPQVHYDGRKILFSYRPAGSPSFHLYEINIDGTGLRQLTGGPDDDIEPTYLPDGGIMFCSSRCRRFVNCWFTRVATLYRCDADGANVRMISSNNDHDNTPWPLPDGRVLYMRWEYVDRSQVHFHHLWTVNPDGTGVMVYYGNEFAGTAMLDAKPIPGTNHVVASFSPGHGMPEHMGYVTVVAPSAGPDVQASAKQISNNLYRDPFAISQDCFLVADREGIHVMDGQGNSELVYRSRGDSARLECHEPRPLAPRPREAVMPSRINPAEPTGELFLADVYHGRNMEGVNPGEIEKFLVLEQLPEPVHFSGGMEPISIGGTFTLARVLGTVPVEPDGSAYMELPALRSLFLVALDKNDLAVKRMQSFVTLQPGERTSCAGCHEQRSKAVPPGPDLLAVMRPASRVEPIHDVPDVLDFPRDIQPILDRHCTGCHDADRREGGVDLSGDHTPYYSISYWTMNRRALVADGRNQPYGNRTPRSIGGAASRLVELIDTGHQGVHLSERERMTVLLWIETSAAYPGTYASLGSGMYPVDYPMAMLRDRCGGCHGRPESNKKGRTAALEIAGATQLDAMTNLDRPEKSLLLRAPLGQSAGGLELCAEIVFPDADDPGYRELLAATRNAAEKLRQQKRFDMPGFRPNEHYIREMQRFEILPQDLRPDAPIDVYATDRAYWQSFWYRPTAKLTPPAGSQAAAR
jgi:hypothetical protein